MDFKSILTKLDGIEKPAATPAAPVLPQAVQLNEDAELRVLAGTSSYVAEAKKAKPDFLDADKDGDKKEPMKKALKDKEKGAVEEGFDSDAKPGDTFKTKTGTATKTKTGVKHTRDKFEYDPGSDDKDDKKAKAKARAKTESIDTEEFKDKFEAMVEAKKKPSSGMTKKEKSAVVKKAKAGEDIGKKGKGFEKVEKAAKKGGAKDPKAVAAAAMWKQQAKEGYANSKRVVAEGVEKKLSFKQMVQLVQESGGQQQIDPIDTALFNWATRVAVSKLGEGTKAELYAGLIYERNGGVFEMYDVLSEDQK